MSCGLRHMPSQTRRQSGVFLAGLVCLQFTLIRVVTLRQNSSGKCARGWESTRPVPVRFTLRVMAEWKKCMRTLGAQRALSMARDQKDWDVQLPLVLLACRSAVQESTGCTPALLMLGRELWTPAELAYGRPPDCPDSLPGAEYASKEWSVQQRMEVAHRFAHEQTRAAGRRQKRLYDVHVKGTHFVAGDLVWCMALNGCKEGAQS